jgi:hypothetical protein
VKWSWIFPVLLLLSCLPARAADFGDISVRIESLSPGSNERGYQEFRATISNHSPAKAHRVTLVFPHQLYRLRGNAIREMTRTVEVAPNATAVVSLFQPPLSLAGAGVRVLIDGREQETPLPFTFNAATGMPGHGSSEAPVLVSEEIVKRGVPDRADEILKAGPGSWSFDYARAELPVTEWSTHWLGYSRYSGVVLTTADWRAMPDAVRGALWRYLECGGTLLIFGGAEIPTHWQATRTEVSPDAQPTRATSRVEMTTPPEPAVTPTPTPAPLPPINVRESLQSYAVGLGQLFVMPAQPQPALTPAQWQKVEESWRKDRLSSSRPYESHNASFERLNGQLPIIKRLTTPVRGLFLLMLLFVIVIGPVNLLVLARRRKKLWLLWTVPAISLVTCLAIAAYAIASEGVASYTRTLCLTVLDEHEHRATSIGVIGFYSPLTPSDGLHFGYDTELTPLLPYTYYYNDRGGTPRTLDWSNEQHLSSGWVSARVPTWFQVRKSETRRERLSVSTNDRGVITVTNGLGVPIRQLWLPDQRRLFYEARDIAPGAQVELTRSNSPVGLGVTRPLHTLVMSDWQDEFMNFEKKREEWLAPGTYLAVLDAAPFIEPGLRNVRQSQAKTLLYGIRGK